MDALGIGADAQLMIVKVGGEVFLASKSQKQISLLTKLELTPEEIESGAVQPTGFADNFRTVLEGQLSRARPLWGKPSGAPGGTGAGMGGDANVFRDNIDRLKGLSPDSGEERQPSD